MIGNTVIEKKIIFVTGTRGIPDIMGGIESHCQELYPNIVKLGGKVFVARRKKYAEDQNTEYKGVNIIDIDVPKNKYAETILHTFLSIIQAKRLHADIVHIHAIGPSILSPLAKWLGMKVVVTHHGADYERDKWGWKSKLFLRFAERIGMKWADEVIVISKVIKSSVEKKFGRMDCHLIYNGVMKAVMRDNTEYLESLGIEKGHYILSMCRIVPSKKLEDIIDAFISAKCHAGDENPCKLVIAGECDFEDEYSAKIKAMAKLNHIVLPGFVSGKERETLLSNARCFVLASSHEGKAISLLEAMSYHLKLVVSDIPANMEMGLDSDCYFHTGHVSELTEKLNDIVKSDIERPTYDMRQYNWDDIAKKTWNVYLKAMGA